MSLRSNNNRRDKKSLISHRTFPDIKGRYIQIIKEIAEVAKHLQLKRISRAIFEPKFYRHQLSSYLYLYSNFKRIINKYKQLIDTNYVITHFQIIFDIFDFITGDTLKEIANDYGISPNYILKISQVVFEHLYFHNIRFHDEDLLHERIALLTKQVANGKIASQHFKHIQNAHLQALLEFPLKSYSKKNYHTKGKPNAIKDFKIQSWFIAWINELNHFDLNRIFGYLKMSEVGKEEIFWLCNEVNSQDELLKLGVYSVAKHNRDLQNYFGNNWRAIEDIVLYHLHRSDFDEIFKKLSQSLNLLEDISVLEKNCYHIFLSIQKKMPHPSKYKNVKKLAPIVIYMFLKAEGYFILKDQIITLLGLNPQEFSEAYKRAIMLYPKYQSRNIRLIIINIIIELQEFFRLPPPFVDTSIQILNSFWGDLYTTKEEVSVAIVAVFTLIYLEIKSVTFSSICEKLGLSMGALNSRIKKIITKGVANPVFTGIASSQSVIKSVVAKKMRWNSEEYLIKSRYFNIPPANKEVRIKIIQDEIDLFTFFINTARKKFIPSFHEYLIPFIKLNQKLKFWVHLNKEYQTKFSNLKQFLHTNIDENLRNTVESSVRHHKIKLLYLGYFNTLKELYQLDIQEQGIIIDNFSNLKQIFDHLSYRGRSFRTGIIFLNLLLIKRDIYTLIQKNSEFRILKPYLTLYEIFLNEKQALLKEGVMHSTYRKFVHMCLNSPDFCEEHQKTHILATPHYHLRMRFLVSWFGLNEKFSKHVLTFIRTSAEKGFVIDGKNIKGIVAAAIYFQFNKDNMALSQKFIASKFSITEVTLRISFQEFKKVNSGIFEVKNEEGILNKIDFFKENLRKQLNNIQKDFFRFYIRLRRHQKGIRNNMRYVVYDITIKKKKYQIYFDEWGHFQSYRLKNYPPLNYKNLNSIKEMINELTRVLVLHGDTDRKRVIFPRG